MDTNLESHQRLKTYDQSKRCRHVKRHDETTTTQKVLDLKVKGKIVESGREQVRVVLVVHTIG